MRRIHLSPAFARHRAIGAFALLATFAFYIDEIRARWICRQALPFPYVRPFNLSARERRGESLDQSRNTFFDEYPQIDGKPSQTRAMAGGREKGGDETEG